LTSRCQRKPDHFSFRLSAGHDEFKLELWTALEPSFLL